MKRKEKWGRGRRKRERGHEGSKIEGRQEGEQVRPLYFYPLRRADPITNYIVIYQHINNIK